MEEVFYQDEHVTDGIFQYLKSFSWILFKYYGNITSMLYKSM